MGVLRKGQREVDRTDLSSAEGGTDRRSFMKVLMGGIAVAIPAFSMLATASPAHASPLVCEEVYIEYEGHSCGRYDGSCPAGNTTNCVGIYYARCTCWGIVCYTFTDNEGRCSG